jgi:rubrerythrin
MFGKESKPCRVFEYGCLRPASGEDAMIEEIRRRNDYWNRLVEIERQDREERFKILAVPGDPIPALVEEMQRLREEIRDLRKKERSGKVDTTEKTARLAELRQQIAELVLQLKTERKERAKDPAVKAELNRLESRRQILLHQARHESGLYWGNYGDVEMAYDVARKKALKSGLELRFHRFDGTGKVTVRWQHGLPVEEVFECRDTRLQIEPVPDAAWTSPARSVRRKMARSVVRLRVRGGEKNKPIWVELPFIMHRPLPAGGRIQTASVCRERVGDGYRYKLVITVSLPDYLLKECKLDKCKACGIDLGWRMVSQGLRVAYLMDVQGKQEELILPHRMLNVFEKCEDLRSIRDRNFNAAKSELVNWLKLHPGILDGENIEQWHSPGRLAHLVDGWQRVPGDDNILSYLQTWRKQEKHLYAWEFNARDQVQRWRREEYRKFAARVVKNYDVIALEDFDLRQIARKPAPENGTRGSLPPDRQRVIASVSELRQTIENAANRERKEVVKIPAAYTTITCNQCGHTEKFDSARNLKNTCPKCGTLWDQDENAARNLLAQVV